MEGAADITGDKKRDAAIDAALFFAVSVGLVVIVLMSSRQGMKRDAAIAVILKQMNEYCAERPDQAGQMVISGNRIPGLGGVFYQDGNEIVFLKPHR